MDSIVYSSLCAVAALMTLFTPSGSSSSTLTGETETLTESKLLFVMAKMAMQNYAWQYMHLLVCRHVELQSSSLHVVIAQR